MKARIERTLNDKEFYDIFITMVSLNYSKEKRLTPREKEIVIEFMSLGKKFEHNRFSKQARKIVRDKFGITSLNMNNLLMNIKKKGYLTVDEDDITTFSPMLSNIINKTELELSFKFNVKYGNI